VLSRGQNGSTVTFNFSPCQGIHNCSGCGNEQAVQGKYMNQSCVHFMNILLTEVGWYQTSEITDCFQETSIYKYTHFQFIK
jgi:hypothetical protein